MKTKLTTACLLLLMIFVVLSCASTGTNPTKRIAEAKEVLFDIKGEALWEGEEYIVYPLAIASYRGVCGQRKGVQIVRVKRVRLWHLRLLDVAVWLEPVWEEMEPEELDNLRYHRKPVMPETVEIAEKECEYVPRLTVVPVGSRVEVVNDDRKDHWVVIEGEHFKRRQFVQLYSGTPPEFTLNTPRIHHVPEGAPIVFNAKRTDKWHLQSGFHMWMEGWVFVTDKIWFSKVDSKGLFEIKGVPRGVYRVNTWHPLLGLSSTVVKVPEESRDIVKISYIEAPEDIERITSSHITTAGEVREEYDVWEEIEEW